MKWAYDLFEWRNEEHSKNAHDKLHNIPSCNYYSFGFWIFFGFFVFETVSFQNTVCNTDWSHGISPFSASWSWGLSSQPAWTATQKPISNTYKHTHTHTPSRVWWHKPDTGYIQHETHLKMAFKMGVGKTVQRLRVHTGLDKDPGLIPAPT